jgi:hypothetical protein
MSMPLTADDVLVGVLYEWRKVAGDDRLTADRQLLHKAFEEVKTSFKEMMSVFNFRQRETFAESAELDQALSNLDATGLISLYNQTPRCYMLGESLNVCFESFSKDILGHAGITTEMLIKAASKVHDALRIH